MSKRKQFFLKFILLEHLQSISDENKGKLVKIQKGVEIKKINHLLQNKVKKHGDLEDQFPMTC